VLAALLLWIGSAALTPAPLRPQVVCRPLSLAVEAITSLLAGQQIPGKSLVETDRAESVAQGCIERVNAALVGSGVTR
jgi:hypothetical protein